MKRGALLVALALLAVARSAAADNESCASAYERAQSRRREAKLLDARKELIACAQDACPSFVRKDCVSWLGQVEGEIPSLTVRVHGPDGCDRPAAEVRVDGIEAARAAEGTPIELDPGAHTVRVSTPTESAEQVVVVAVGERRRFVTIDLGSPGAVCGRPKVDPPVRAPEAREKVPPVRSAASPTPSHTLVYVLGGVGLAAAGVGLGFGIAAWSQKGDLDDCRGTCAQADVDTMRRTFLVADIGVLVAIASLGAAGILYFVR